MPNLKTSIKDLRQNKRREEYNRRIRNRMKKAIKNFDTLIEEKDTKKAEVALVQVYKILDKAAQKNIIKDNTASRKKSRLATKLNKTAQDNVKSSKKGAQVFVSACNINNSDKSNRNTPVKLISSVRYKYWK